MIDSILRVFIYTITSAMMKTSIRSLARVAIAAQHCCAETSQLFAAN